MPKAAMTVLLDDARERVLMIWRHRFVLDCWTWELPGGYVDVDEDPAVTAADLLVEALHCRFGPERSKAA